jgi:hypothetical protein
VDPFDILQTLSEIGIAITGFAGVAAALGPRGRADWSDFERGNLHTLLVWSVAAVFLSYVPIVLHGLGSLLSQPWRVSHAIFATYHSWIFLQFFRQMHANPVWRDRLALILSAIGLLVLALEITSAIGITGALAPILYIVAVLWFLFLAVTRFVVLVTATILPPAA